METIYLSPRAQAGRCGNLFHKIPCIKLLGIFLYPLLTPPPLPPRAALYLYTYTLFFSCSPKILFSDHGRQYISSANKRQLATARLFDNPCICETISYYCTFFLYVSRWFYKGLTVVVNDLHQQ